MNLRMAITQDFKGALCSFGEEIQTHNFNFYNMNEITREEMVKVPRTLFEDLLWTAAICQKK